MMQVQAHMYSGLSGVDNQNIVRETFPFVNMSCF